MLTYINGEFKTSIGDSLPNAAEPWKQVARFRASMTPEEFVEFWDTDICKMAHDGMECPVKLGCKACGKEEGTFSRCGKCEVVKYCDRECQVKDWKVHKQVCNK
ncbi:uncharacterized protein RCC_00008 [Ramularia collo-cygni]|uniref:MYND-type domain-containing protein n=1 Tax=Ramularia collo-cygni TaxID=112498 RepID=A0A2D3V1B9_9PEZI|nr:uncharacterized protein RCC_00008 [Ramularia collo-cygni]CZT14033.1 uncharacterized protein RCC_00008 [Ramularia collo-cygni]